MLKHGVTAGHQALELVGYHHLVAIGISVFLFSLEHHFFSELPVILLGEQPNNKLLQF